MVRMPYEITWDEVLQKILLDSLRKWFFDALTKRRMIPVTEFMFGLGSSDAKAYPELSQLRMRIDVAGFRGNMFFDFNPLFGFFIEIESPKNSVEQVRKNTEKLRLLAGVGASVLQVRLCELDLTLTDEHRERYRRFREVYQSFFDLRKIYEDVTYRKFSTSEILILNPEVKLEVLYSKYRQGTKKIHLPSERFIWWMEHLMGDSKWGVPVSLRRAYKDLWKEESA